MGHSLSRQHNMKIKKKSSSKDSSDSSVKNLMILLMKLTANVSGVCEGISRDVFTSNVFKKYPDLSQRIFTFMLSNDTTNPPVLKPNIFESCIERILNSLTYNEVFLLYVDMYYGQRDCLSTEEFQSIATLSYSIFVDNHPDGPQACPKGMNVIRSLVEGLYNKNSKLEVVDLMSITEINCPRLIRILHSYVINTLYSAYQEITEPTRAYGKASKLNAESSLALTPSKVWILTTVLPHLYMNSLSHKLEYSTLTKTPCNSTEICLSDYNFPIHWERLYNSALQGSGAKYFVNHVFNYKGPTLLFLCSKYDKEFCVCISGEWHESETFWGGADCMLIQLSPIYRILHKDVVIYVNFSGHNVYHGIEIGSDRKEPIISINETLDRMTLDGKKIKLYSIEVWGCGLTYADHPRPGNGSSQKTEIEQNCNRFEDLERVKLLSKLNKIAYHGN